MRSFYILFSFFVITPSVLVGVMLFFFLLNFPQKSSLSATSPISSSKSVAFAALPTSQNTLGGEILEGDARIARVKNFLDRFHSPLAAYADRIVENADNLNIDYRLIPSIAVQESGGCKKIIEDSFNCFGYGIYGKNVTRFSNFAEAIDTVSRYLGKHVGRGLNTPQALGTLYNPSNHNNWSENVQNFMDQI